MNPQSYIHFHWPSKACMEAIFLTSASPLLSQDGTGAKTGDQQQSQDGSYTHAVMGDKTITLDKPL